MEKEKEKFSPYGQKIICKNYPTEFVLDKTIAKEYFRQFGKLKRITFKPRLAICTVEYADNQSFLNALNNAGEYNGTFFEVSVEKLPESKKKKAEKSSKRKLENSPGKKIKSKPLWVDNGDVQAELEAMSGVAPKTYGIPEVIDLTDSLSEVPKSEKTIKLKRTWIPEVNPQTKRRARSQENSSAFVSRGYVELVNLLLSQATTVEEKYRVLDARDKLLRLKLKESLQLKLSTTVGTCPDMCPEKERLMRETQHQVALYEQDDNGRFMNQHKAVKQYSRSSADQEAALPHELRPVSVLQMTIGYLMHNIMDLCDTDEVNVAEWYHFLWDRTRSIRKDITQQELCCQGSVELVEQCARFHIHCAARLVAEDPSVFDQKINTENLTKCLQTLKYMYHDLQLKGESCRNEAEFRAYVILLNLNDGNFMWEVQQLLQDIQKSKEIRFALAVHSALDKSNYVKFFKLVRSTTYLNACILMRYFVQVRITATKTLLKCYTPRISRTVFPLSELVRILAFDDLESTVYFMQTYGLNVNEEKTHITLEKNSFALPEFPYVLDRSNIVESKRIFSVGRVICGKDLPPKTYENHVPQNSFDAKGYLVCKDILEETDLMQAKSKLLAELGRDSDLSDMDSSQNTEQECGASPSILTQKLQAPKETSFSSIFDKKPAMVAIRKDDRSIFGQPLVTQISIFPKETSLPISSEPLSAMDQTDSVSVPSVGIFATSTPGTFDAVPFVPVEIPKLIFSEPKKGGFAFHLPEVVAPPVITSTSTERVTEDSEKLRKQLEDKALKEVEELKKKQEQEKRKLEEAARESQRLKLLKKKELEEELIKRMQELRKAEELIRKKEEMKKELEIKTAVTDVIDSMVTAVDAKICEETLAKIRQQIRKRAVSKAIKKWQLIVVRNKRKRKAMDCSPVWVNTKTLKQSADELRTSSQDLTLKLMKRYKYGKPLDIDVALEEKVRKINLFELTHSTLKKRLHDLTGRVPKNLFWKVLVSLPDEMELIHGVSRIEETLGDAFMWQKRNGDTILIEQIKPNSAESVTYCVEKQTGLNVKDSDASGIIFVAKNFNPRLLRRIFENLKNFGVFTKVPIVVLLEDYDRSEGDLKVLIEENIVSNYVILVENLSPHGLLNLVEEGLVFLASKIEQYPPLQLDTVRSFVTKYLCTEIWKRANSFAKWNSHYKTCLRDPNIVINLYNEALAKLKKIALNKSCKEYATFPEVFKDHLESEIPDFLPCNYYYFPKFWKSQSYVDELEKIMKNLRLARWRDPWPPSNEFELEVGVSKYCTQAFKEPEKPFYRIMGVLLRNVDPNVSFRDVANVPWTEVVEVLGLEKLKEAKLTLTGTEFENKSIYNQFVVVYDADTLRNYNMSDWFYVNNPVIKKYVKKQLNEEKKKIPAVETTLDLDLSVDLDKTIAEVTNQLLNESNSSVLLKELKDFNALLDDLETSIKIDKRISSRLGENLRKALEDN